MKRFSLTKFAGGSLLLLLAIACSDDTGTDPTLADAAAPDAGEPGTDNKDAGANPGNGGKDAGADLGKDDAGAIGKGDAATPNDAGQILTDAGQGDASANVPDGGDALPDDGGASADAGDGGMTDGDECIGSNRDSAEFLGCIALLTCGELGGRCSAYNGRFRAEVFDATLSCHAAASEGLGDSCGADSLAALETCAAEAQEAACVTAVPGCVAVEERCGAVSVSRCEQDLAPLNGDYLDGVLACFSAAGGDAGADCESEWLTCLDPLPE